MCACAIMLPVQGIEHQGLLEERAVCSQCGRVWLCFTTAEMRATAARPPSMRNTPADQPTIMLPLAAALLPGRAAAGPGYLRPRESAPAIPVVAADPDAPAPPYVTRR